MVGYFGIFAAKCQFFAAKCQCFAAKCQSAICVLTDADRASHLGLKFLCYYMCVVNFHKCFSDQG